LDDAVRLAPSRLNDTNDELKSLPEVFWTAVFSCSDPRRTGGTPSAVGDPVVLGCFARPMSGKLDLYKSKETCHAYLAVR
jgi:hypothetical protein